ncbi:hypothetical protein TKK_0005111 [Trichogramma kaykai]|uniref:Cytochrome P450 n=1 Tax=Trichogramma kaykai TaxID=54128 RepID=A0ABD2XJI9_9HYME
MAVTVSIIIYGLIAFVTFAFYAIVNQFTYWKRRKIPHIKPIPLIGNNGPVLLRLVPFPDHSKMLYAHHPGARYFGMFDFRNPTIVVKDPELLKDIFVKNFDHFTDHVAFVSEEMDPIVGKNLFSLKGQRWRELRNTLSPSFTTSRMKAMFELIVECSNHFTDYFVQHPELAEEFEAKSAFTRYTSDVIATSAFGIEVNSMKNPDNEFFKNGQSFTSFPVTWIIKILFMTILPKLMRQTGATFLPKSTDLFFKSLINESVKMRLERGIVRQDMIHLLCRAMVKKDDESRVTMDDLVAQSVIFFLAGFETTSSLICFVCHELAVNPEIQERLRAEVDAHYGEYDRRITYDSLVGMKYLDMVMSETLRKYPGAPLTNRVCTKDYDFPPAMDGCPGYRMKKGQALVIPVYGFHTDPRYFPEPEKFDPERFSPENKVKIDPYTYLPFGIGPRECIGKRFALMETKIIVINVLKKFVIKFTEKSEHPVRFAKKTFTTTARGGCWLKLERRV